MWRIVYYGLYLVGFLCILVNIVVLLSKTIFDDRIYDMIVAVLMISSILLQLNFMYKACRGEIKRPLTPCNIPRRITISAIVPSGGIVFGYAYYIVFNMAFSNCDKLIDGKSIMEQFEDGAINILMILFCLLSLFYIWQRSFFGPIPTNSDRIMRRWVNVVFTVVWLHILVTKAYETYEELCGSKELTGYWCPKKEAKYQCDPDQQLIGTQKIWYFLHKELLNSAIISRSIEFFPVLLVAHWIACGGGENAGNNDGLELPMQRKRSHLLIFGDNLSDNTFGSATDDSDNSPITITKTVDTIFISFALLSSFGLTVNWFVDFYASIRFDSLHARRSMVDDYADFGASIAHLLLFSIFWLWSRKAIPAQRWDQSKRALSFGDLVLILGSAIFMTVKSVLELMEFIFQWTDGFLFWNETIFQIATLLIIQTSQWIQVFCLRRVVCFHGKDLQLMRHFLPFVAVAAGAVNIVDFGTTFFEMNLIKYQLGLPQRTFSQRALLSIIFTQTISPADYLFCFTAAGCWMDVVLRYVEMGMFQLGSPSPNPGKNKEEEENKC